MSAQMAAVLSLLTQDQWAQLAIKAPAIVAAMPEAQAHPAIAALAAAFSERVDLGDHTHAASVHAAHHVLSHNLFAEPDPAADTATPTIASTEQHKPLPALPAPTGASR